MINTPLTVIGYYLMKYQGRLAPAFKVLPSFQSVVFDICIFMVAAEIASYYVHRLTFKNNSIVIKVIKYIFTGQTASPSMVLQTHS